MTNKRRREMKTTNNIFVNISDEKVLKKFQTDDNFWFDKTKRIALNLQVKVQKALEWIMSTFKSSSFVINLWFQVCFGRIGCEVNNQEKCWRDHVGRVVVLEKQGNMRMMSSSAMWKLPMKLKSKFAISSKVILKHSCCSFKEIPFDDCEWQKTVKKNSEESCEQMMELASVKHRNITRKCRNRTLKKV